MKLLLFLAVIYITAPQADVDGDWASNKYYAQRIADLIENSPAMFDREFPNSSVEETGKSLRKLKRVLSWLRYERACKFFSFVLFSG